MRVIENWQLAIIAALLREKGYLFGGNDSTMCNMEEILCLQRHLKKLDDTDNRD